MKLIFCQHLNIKVFFKLILSFLVCMVKHVQSFQNNKFAFSLQYLGKEVKTSLNATNWFTYTHFKQVWSDMAALAQCAYSVLKVTGDKKF